MRASQSDVQPRIFVQIASYRDPECQWTIKDLFSRADHPDRVFVGVCWQFVADEDTDCFVISTRPEQVRTIEFDASESQGLGWARGCAQKLWQGEEYNLQIDSHMRFVDGWDTKMIEMLGRCPSSKPVLTHYPPAYLPPDTRLRTAVGKVHAASFQDAGSLLLILGGSEHLAASPTPSPSPFCAGGFVFAAGLVNEEVPHDPHIFFVDETAYSARLWTHGYDFFAPNEILIYHYYGLRDRLRRHGAGCHDASERHRRTAWRVSCLLGSEVPDDSEALVDLDRYGLGGQRTLREFEVFTGVNFHAHTIARYAQSWPFYLTEDLKRRRDNVRRRPALTDHAQAFIVDEGGIVFFEPAQEIYQLNSAAMFIWCRLEEGVHEAEIIDRLGRLLGTSKEQVDHLLTETLQHWWDLGLLAGSPAADGTAYRQMREGREMSEIVDREHFPKNCTIKDPKSRLYKMLDATVQVQFETSEPEKWVHPPVAHLETDSSAATVDSTISIISRNQQQFVYLDGKPIYRCRELASLVPVIKGQILLAGINSRTYFMCVHSGVVRNGDTCLLMPGESGRGKSSLTAAFVKSGFAYCSDEVALLSEETFEATPLPVAMCIKDTAFGAIEKLFPETADLPTYARDDGKVVRYFLPPDGRLSPPVGKSLPVRKIIFPNYDPSRPSSLLPVDKAEAMRIILGECIAIPRHLDHLAIGRFVRWIRAVECCRLTLSSVEDGVAFGKELLAEDLPVPASAAQSQLSLAQSFFCETQAPDQDSRA